MLLRYLNDTTFLYWLDFFQSILPQSEILFKQMQKRNIIYLVTIKNNIQNFDKSIQNAVPLTKLKGQLNQHQEEESKLPAQQSQKKFVM